MISKYSVCRQHGANGIAVPSKQESQFQDKSISSGNSVMFTSNLSWTSFRILASASSETKVIAKPLVPNRPARATRCKTHKHSNAVERLKSRLILLFDNSKQFIFVARIWRRYIHNEVGKSENENNALLGIMSGEMTELR
uniref:Uncharacterized protein n=1 Tax=Glossina brevipalpis TaxID=37001 RepID=A0A1A9X0Q0_9MUSC